jgi:hypothetical protein
MHGSMGGGRKPAPVGKSARSQAPLAYPTILRVGVPDRLLCLHSSSKQQAHCNIVSDRTRTAVTACKSARRAAEAKAARASAGVG